MRDRLAIIWLRGESPKARGKFFVNGKIDFLREKNFLSRIYEEKSFPPFITIFFSLTHRTLNRFHTLIMSMTTRDIQSIESIQVTDGEGSVSIKQCLDVS